MNCKEILKVVIMADNTKGNNQSLSLYIIAAVACISLLFAGAYNPEKYTYTGDPNNSPQQVTLHFNKKNNSKSVTPVKTKTDQTSRLKKKTPYISEKENKFSGKTGKKNQKWVRPNDKTGENKNRLNNSDPGKKGGHQKSKKKDLYSIDKSAKKKTVRSGIFKAENKKPGLSNKDKLGFLKDSLSVFQELPHFKNINTDLLVNFDSNGRISLGTRAYKHSDYFFKMVRKISKNWELYFPIIQHYYGLLKSGEVVVVFKLDLQGRVKWVKLVKSYGQNSLDYACIMSIKESKEFGLLPKELRKNGGIKVPFQFSYKRPEKPHRMFR